MAQRDISGKQRAWLVAELDAWRSRDLVSTEQVSGILQVYASPAELASRHRSTLLLVLMGVAALLVGLAALLLMGHNWQAMPASLKLLLILTTLLATHGIGFLLRYRRASPLLSEVAYCLAGIFYGVAIFLIAQIFHLQGHYPDAVWWWALGVLPFAICLDSVLLHILLVALLAIWCGMEVFGFADLGGWFWGRWSFIPNGAYSLLLLALPGLVWAYRRSSLAAVWLYVALLAWWTFIQPFAWHLDELSPIFVGAVAGLMLILAESHPRASRLAAPYRELGVLLAAFTLFVLSFHETNKWIFNRDSFYRRPDWRPAPFLGAAGAWALMAATLIAAVGVLYLASKLQPSSSSQPLTPIERMFQTARRQWYAVGLVALMLVLFAWWNLDGGPMLPTILANIGMIVLGFSLVTAGLHQDSGRTFAAGVIYLLLWAVSRYIDLFGDAGGMLGAAGIFLVCGLALFAVAWFWRHRREALDV